MSLTFLRLELAARDGQPSPILVNVDHIVRIHPTWPHGCTIVTTDDVSLNVRANMDEIQSRLTATNGRTTVLKVEHKACGDIDAVYETARADLSPGHPATDVADWGDTDDKLRAYYGGKGI